MSKKTVWPGLFACMLAVQSVPACAVESAPGAELLAELVIGQEKPAVAKPAGARTQREQAGSYARDLVAPPVVVGEDEESGFLSPRGGAPAEEKAYEERAKARSYQHGSGATGGAVTILPGDTASPTGDLRGRAKAYSGTGNLRDVDLSNVGRDGIPIVPCLDVDNVSGRIGDDTTSGAIVHLIRQGKQIKVRCK